MDIIIVDDEGIVRDVLSTILSDSGFTVHTAGSGREGLELLAEIPAEFLITDFLMPQMSGVELIEEARQVRPETKVILMSGHVDVDGSMEEAAHDAHAVLHKPFDFRTLKDLLIHSPAA